MAKLEPYLKSGDRVRYCVMDGHLRRIYEGEVMKVSDRRTYVHFDHLGINIDAWTFNDSLVVIRKAKR